MTCYLLFIYILDYRNYVRQKANSSDFLFKFKMCHKIAEITCNISNAFSPGAANEHTVQWWFQMFPKGDENLEDEECSGQSSEVDNDQLRVIIEADPLKTTQEVAEEFNIEHSTVLCHLKKLERWKSSISGCLMNVHKSKKLSFWRVVFSFCTQQQTIFCEKKSGFYMTIGGDRLSGWTKKKLQSTSQSQTCTKKKVMICVGGMLPVWSTTAFWIPAKSLHLTSMLGKLTRCTENCNVCSLCWLAERAQCFSMTMPNCMLHNQCFRSWTNFAQLPYSPDLSPNDNLSLLQASQQLLAGKRLPQPAGGRKCFARVHQIRSMDFYATGINKLISLWQTCVDWNGSYFD